MIHNTVVHVIVRTYVCTYIDIDIHRSHKRRWTRVQLRATESDPPLQISMYVCIYVCVDIDIWNMYVYVCMYVCRYVHSRYNLSPPLPSPSAAASVQHEGCWIVPALPCPSVLPAGVVATAYSVTVRPWIHINARSETVEPTRGAGRSGTAPVGGGGEGLKGG